MGESWEHMISLWDSNLTNHILPVFQESTPSKTIVASTDEHWEVMVDVEDETTYPGDNGFFWAMGVEPF